MLAGLGPVLLPVQTMRARVDVRLPPPSQYPRYVTGVVTQLPGFGSVWFFCKSSGWHGRRREGPVIPPCRQLKLLQQDEQDHDFRSR